MRWISGLAANLFYLFIVVAAVASFVALIYTSRRGLRDLARGKIDNIDNMPLYGVATLFAAAISFNLIFNMIVMASGGDPSAPTYTGPYWGLWYQYLEACVWEEVLCRVLMIGIPMAALGLMLKEKRPWKRLFGRFEMDASALVFIIISASMFSYAHLAGWDVFKIAPTFVTGLALGYLFVKYGIHASIMLHFLTNYLSSVEWILGDDLGAIVLSMFTLIVLIFGPVFLVVYTLRGLRFIKKIASKAQKPPETVT
jgi:hypothetical protein